MASHPAYSLVGPSAGRPQCVAANAVRFRVLVPSLPQVTLHGLHSPQGFHSPLTQCSWHVPGQCDQGCTSVRLRTSQGWPPGPASCATVLERFLLPTPHLMAVWQAPHSPQSDNIQSWTPKQVSALQPSTSLRSKVQPNLPALGNCRIERSRVFTPWPHVGLHADQPLQSDTVHSPFDDPGQGSILHFVVAWRLVCAQLWPPLLACFDI
mmetsp:Transcript_43037/g.68110  ORF Transcript_43037/g.68110 Transcript_43037/m.68110 type:complete len:209 (-) Transcript_43037:2880-3506(-)